MSDDLLLSWKAEVLGLIIMDPPATQSTRIELPKLSGKNFCPYTEPRPGKQHIWTWINKFFPDSSSAASKYFVNLLAGIMNDACDPKDKGRICLSDVPSPIGKQTASPYSADELAAWWNEAVDNMPTHLLCIEVPVTTPVVRQEDDEEPEEEAPAPAPIEPEPEFEKPRPTRRSRRKSFDDFE